MTGLSPAQMQLRRGEWKVVRGPRGPKVARLLRVKLVVCWFQRRGQRLAGHHVCRLVNPLPGTSEGQTMASIPVPRIFWPTHLSEAAAGLIVGWNVRSLIGCVATVVSNVTVRRP